MKRRRNNFMGDMITTGVGSMVGIGLTGATSSMVNTLPAGSTERTIAGIVPGLQSTAIVGQNLGMVNRSLAMGQPRMRKRVVRRRVRKMRF